LSSWVRRLGHLLATSSLPVDTLFVIDTSALWRTVQPTGKLVGDAFGAGRVLITPIIAWPSSRARRERGLRPGPRHGQARGASFASASGSRSGH
jgi:hypothetical protein